MTLSEGDIGEFLQENFGGKIENNLGNNEKRHFRIGRLEKIDDKLIDRKIIEFYAINKGMIFDKENSSTGRLKFYTSNKKNYLRVTHDYGFNLKSLFVSEHKNL